MTVDLIFYRFFGKGFLKEHLENSPFSILFPEPLPTNLRDLIKENEKAKTG